MYLYKDCWNTGEGVVGLGLVFILITLLFVEEEGVQVQINQSDGESMEKQKNALQK